MQITILCKRICYLFLLLITGSCLSPNLEVPSSASKQESSLEGIPDFVQQEYPDLKSKLVLAYTDGDLDLLSRYETLLDSIWIHQSFFSRWVTQEVVSVPISQHDSYDHQLQETDILIILSHSKSDLSFLGKELPFSWEDEGFRFLNKNYPEQNDLVLFSHTGLDDSIPRIHVMAANDPANLVKYLPYFQSEGYHLFRDSKRLLTGNWLEEGEGWTVDSSSHRDLLEEITGNRTTTYFQFHNHTDALSGAEFDRFINQTEQRFERISEFLNLDTTRTTRIDYYLYSRFEDKGIFFGDFNTSYGRILPDVKHVDVEHQEVHRSLGQEIDMFDWYHDVPPFLYQLLGESDSDFLETGLSIYFSEIWHEKGYAYWALRLHYADQVPPLKELLDDKRDDFISPFIVESMAGSFVSYLLNVWGKDVFLEKYVTWDLTEEEIEELEKTWRGSLEVQYVATKDEIEIHRASFPNQTSFQKGFTYAPNPGSHGYLTRSSDASLGRLNDLGVGAVSLIPYASVPKNHPASLYPERRINGENDAAMVHAILDAKRLGQTVMLKPQLATNGWTGDIEMNSEAEWDAFFDYYERWISHYALMAELYGVEVLCIGTELVRATEKEDRWIALANKIRRLYSGKLVYASNWGEEFERVSFWRHFDYIGIDNYYPLSQADNPADIELVQSAQEIARWIKTISQSYDRPVLFTEIGFSGTLTPWKQPHDVAGQPDLEGISQARSYDAWFQVLHGESWVSGIYWWKWFSYDPEINLSTDFVPQRKRTEKVLRDWYAKQW